MRGALSETRPPCAPQDHIVCNSNYESFRIETDGLPDSKIMTAITGRTDKWKHTLVAELMMRHGKNQWDGAHIAASFPVTAGSQFRLMFERRCAGKIDNGVWGPMSLLFHPAPAKGQPRFYEHIVAELSNAASLKSNPWTSTNGHLTREILLKQISASNANVLTTQNGVLLAKKTGVVSIEYHQDIIHNCNEMTMFLEVNGYRYGEEINKNTGGKWDGIALGVSVPAQARPARTLPCLCASVYTCGAHS